MAAFLPALLTGLRTAMGKGMASTAKHGALLKSSAFATGALKESVVKLNGSLKTFLQVNERLAVVNSNFGMELKKNSETLKGAEQGFGLAAKAMTEFRILGFKESGKNMVNLATRMKISGQNTGKMMKTFQDLLGRGGVNERNLDNLSTTITQTSLKYGVTSDGIISAMDRLSGNLIDLNIGGGTAAAAETTALLVGMVGEANAALAGQFVNLLSSSKINEINVTARLGVEREGDKIFSGKAPTEEGIARILSMVSTATRSMIGQVGEVQRRTNSALTPTVGELGRIGIVLQEASEKQKEVIGFFDAIKESINNLKATFLAPWQAAVTDMTDSFKFLTESLFMFGGSILNLIGSLAPLIKLIMYVVGGIVRIFAGIVQTISLVLEGIFGGFVTPGTERIDSSANSLGKIIGITSQKSLLSSNKTNSLLARIDGSMSTMVQLEEDKKSEIIKQDLQKLSESGRGIDGRLLAIADFAARTTEGGVFERMLQAQKETNANLNQVINNTVPEPRSALLNPPGGRNQ